jgi:hypothetical protein
MSSGRRDWLRWSFGALGLAWLDACGLTEAPRQRGSPDGGGDWSLLRPLPPGARLVLLLGPWPEAAWADSAGFAVRFVEAGMVPNSGVDVAVLATAIERRARTGQPLVLDAFSEAEVAFLRELLVSLYRTPRAGAALLGQPMPGCVIGE